MYRRVRAVYGVNELLPPGHGDNWQILTLCLNLKYRWPKNGRIPLVHFLDVLLHPPPQIVAYRHRPPIREFDHD
jgi:hypothetical protein